MNSTDIAERRYFDPNVRKKYGIKIRDVQDDVHKNEKPGCNFACGGQKQEWSAGVEDKHRIKINRV